MRGETWIEAFIKCSVRALLALAVSQSRFTDVPFLLASYYYCVPGGGGVHDTWKLDRIIPGYTVLYTPVDRHVP